MKLKSVIIAACSCLCIQAMADGTFFKQFKDNGRIAARLHAVTTQRGMVLSRAGLMAERALPAAAPAGRLRLAPAERNAEEGTLKLDSIIQVNVDGTKLQKQQYVYNDQGKEINRKTSYWNASTQTWDEPYEEYDYEWTDYGYILSQRGVYNGQGVRMDYKYNDKRQGIEQINYELDADGNWVPTSKGEYEYDDNDNIISEYVYAWTGSEWLVATHNTATWDAKKRQTSFESYTWDGSAWVGADKGEYVWFDGPYDPGYVEGSGLDPERMSYKYNYFWIDGAWHNYYIFVNDISETDGRLLGQAEKYYNRKEGKFSGGDDWDGRLSLNNAFTWEGRKTYDEHGAELFSETYRCLPDSSRWVLLGTVDYVWEYDDTGARQGYTNVVNCLYDGQWNKTGEVTNQREYYGYDAENRRVWILQQVADGNGVLKDLFEEKYIYDDKGRHVCTAVWDWDDQGVRKPTSRTEYYYDDDDNIIETISKSGGGGLTPLGAPMTKAPGLTDEDNEGWVNSARWLYTYDRGYMTSKMGYRWQQEQWTTNTGQDWVYDFDNPASEVVVPEGWTDPFKLDAVTDYLADGANGWLTMPREYYWTEFVSTGISDAVADNGSVRIYPRVVESGFNVEAPAGACVRVYSISGSCVVTSTSSWVSVDNLPSGVYIVNVEGYKTKIVKK